MLRLDAWKVAALENRILRRAHLVTAITRDDAIAFRRRGCQAPTIVLGPGYDGPRVRHHEITRAVPRRAVVAGSLVWRVKQHDLLSLLQAADDRFADAGAEIVIIGDAPQWLHDEVHRTTRATRMAGRLDSFDEEFANARLALLSEPHGGGFKLKSLDYVFHRVPLFVQTGSVAGLPLEHDRGLRQYETIEALVEGALSAIDDYDLLNAMQNDAYTACEREFDWTARGRAMTEAILAARRDPEPVDLTEEFLDPSPHQSRPIERT